MLDVDIVVIGASAGGVEALKTLASGLPPDFPDAIFIVLHMAPSSPRLLAEILSNRGPLPATFARDGEQFQGGRIYVAPPDHHMLVEAPDRIRITRGPKENNSRPAVDPLFRSAALAFGPRVTGVVLTGNLDDGTVGLTAIKRRGGIAVVQDPGDAHAASMPRSAMRYVKIDHRVAIAELAPLLVRLAAERTEPSSTSMETMPMAHKLKYEVDAIAQHKAADPADLLHHGHPTLFTCPQCHGSLVQLHEDGPQRFRCHTGHAFTGVSLAAALDDSIEDLLWTTHRALQEKHMLVRHLASHAREHQDDVQAAELFRQASEIGERSELVRRALLGEERVSDVPSPAA